MNIVDRIMLTSLLGIFCLAAHANQFNTVQSSEPYEDVMENVKDAIIGRGLNISNVLAAGEMLNRTGHDLGYDRNVFKHAESIEFCSANLSHQLVSINPNNMVLCPFTISVYQLSGDSETVHVTYRTPDAGKDSAEVIRKVDQLIKSIVQEATE
jgi:uncharacterized protein (DUF302 family)